MTIQARIDELEALVNSARARTAVGLPVVEVAGDNIEAENFKKLRILYLDVDVVTDPEAAAAWLAAELESALTKLLSDPCPLLLPPSWKCS